VRWCTIQLENCSHRDKTQSSVFHPVSFRRFSQRITSVNQCSLVRVHLIKLASNVGVGFQICQPQNPINFLPFG
jgi:hypothetical protein